MTSLKRYSKTFVEHTYYRRGPSRSPNDWIQIGINELAAAGIPTKSVDDQCNEWVDRTGAILLNAGAPAFVKSSEEKGTVMIYTILVTYIFEPGSTDGKLPEPTQT